MTEQPKDVIICGFCKTQNNPNERFCKNCGTLLKRTKVVPNKPASIPEQRISKVEPKVETKTKPKAESKIKSKTEPKATQKVTLKAAPKVKSKVELNAESSESTDRSIAGKIAVIAMVLALIVIVGIGTYQFLTYKIRDNLKERVQKKVVGTWIREENPTFTAQLVIGKDTIVYYYVNQEGEAQKISENSYEVIAGDHIEVAGRGEIQISWEEGGTVMKMQPALTSAKSEEQWNKQ